MLKKPHISIVCTSRNDNHGESLNYRTQIFLDCLAIQCIKHQIYAELLFIEWNPPANRSKLIEVLKWPKSEYLEIRIIEVPEDIHNRYHHSNKIALYQMKAKNVGIRRARGDYVLSTNIDIIFSDSIFKSIKNNLAEDIIYTAIRYDIPHKFPNIPNSEKQRYAKNNIIRIHLQNYSLPIRKKDIPYLRLCGKLYCLYRIANIELKKFNRNKREYKHQSNFFNRLNKIKKYLALISSVNNFFTELINPKNPHTNACGDFTLCSKEVWLKLGGYAEWDLQSWHLDSLFIYQGKNSGYKTEIIKGPIYHIEHSAGSGFTPEYQEILFNRFRENKISFLSNEDLANLVQNQKKTKSTVYNDNLWGLKKDNLMEINPINEEILK
jgi:hypothetical protein